MVDIHCHILPEFDDGAADIYETLEMAKIAVNSGIKTIIATPHCNVPELPQNYYGPLYEETFEKAVSVIKKADLKLTLLKGMEVFVTFDLPSLIKEDKILTLNNSRYLLVEFDFCEDPEFVDFMIDRIVNLGLVPVVAHPERYEFVKYNPHILTTLKSKGCIFQSNKGSFSGSHGSAAKKIAFEMLNNNQTSIIASDAHSMNFRTPDTTKARALLEDTYDIETLFVANPEKICKDMPI